MQVSNIGVAGKIFSLRSQETGESFQGGGKKRIGILGASGCSGAELVRALLGHPIGSRVNLRTPLPQAADRFYCYEDLGHHKCLRILYIATLEAADRPLRWD